MPDELSFINPAAWSDIYVSRPQMPRPEKRMPLINMLGVPPLPTIIRPEDHARQRKIWTHGFSDRALREQEPVLYKNTDKLMQRFKEHAEEDTEIDLADWFQFVAFDILGDLSFGESFGSLENSRYHPWVDSLLGNLKKVRLMQAISLFPSIVDFVSACMPEFVKRRFRTAFAEHFQFVVDQVDKRLAKTPDHADIMKYVIEKNAKQAISRDEIDSTMQIMVFAGSNTTAAALTATVWFLSKKPETMQRLQKEVRGAFSAVANISVSSVTSLPYLHACLMESLRLHTVAPLSSPRLTERPTMIAGYHVPPQTSVGVPQKTAYRHPSCFAEASSYIPTRWLPEADDKFNADKKDVFEPFLVGPRNCMGKNLAWAEMKFILARLIWAFDVELTKNNVEDWTDQKIYSAPQTIPLKVRLRARETT